MTTNTTIVGCMLVQLVSSTLQMMRWIHALLFELLSLRMALYIFRWEGKLCMIALKKTNTMSINKLKGNIKTLEEGKCKCTWFLDNDDHRNRDMITTMTVM